MPLFPSLLANSARFGQPRALPTKRASRRARPFMAGLGATGRAVDLAFRPIRGPACTFRLRYSIGHSTRILPVKKALSVPLIEQMT